MLKKILHYLFHCPTFWSLIPAFKCPDCGRPYRCYWNGHDCICGKINLCKKCYEEKHKMHKAKEGLC